MQQAFRYADKAVMSAPNDTDLAKVRKQAIEDYFIQAIAEEDAAEEEFNNGQFGVGA